ncbi:MAG TPA: sugar phosphate isomerase/epimerase family protein, partial [Rhodothermales bacterium]
MRLTRRDLLTGAALLPAAVPLVAYRSAAAKAAPSGDTRNMHLGLAAYSMRDALTAGEMDLFGFVDWCAELGLPGAELTSYYFPEEFDDSYLHDLRRHAFRRGVTVTGTAIRNNFCQPPGPAKDREIAHVNRWIDHAAELFAPHIRIFAGDLPEGTAKETGIAWVAEGIRAVLPHAAERGIMLGLENHGGITARAADHLAICDAVGDHPWFGVNLDTFNYKTNPYEELAMAAPRAVNVQVKVDMTGPSGELEPTDLRR